MNAVDRPRTLLSAFRAALTVAGLAVLAAGCMTWKDGRAGPAAVVARHPETVRVSLVTGYRFEFDAPAIRGDSLYGTTHGQTLGVPLADVRAVEVRGFALGRTALLVGAGVTTVLVIASVSSREPAPQRTYQTSCPLVYSWDGAEWRLDSGTFGGAITEALARTDVDNLDHARAADGTVRLKVANELAETDHLDALRLLVVDHAPGTTVAPGPDGSIHGMVALQAPRAARDGAGRDALARVAAPDGWSWESSPSRAGERDGIELEFPRPPGALEARILVDAHNTPWASFMLTELVRAHGDGVDDWYAALDADPDRARRFFGGIARDAFLEVSLWTADGWRREGLAWEAGPEIVKRQAVPLDLHGVEGETVRVRLTAPTSFWLIDHVAIGYGPFRSVAVLEIGPAAARTRDGRDVRTEIGSVDGRTWTIETGDWAEVTFAVPDAPLGRERTLLLASTGWYRLDARRDGAPDAEILARLEREPGAIARLSRERRVRALAALVAAR